jgi:hypothetical protein
LYRIIQQTLQTTFIISYLIHPKLWSYFDFDS